VFSVWKGGGRGEAKFSERSPSSEFLHCLGLAAAWQLSCKAI